MQSETLFADKPLTDPILDRLNYASFASNLANSICNMTPPDGLVMAIYGPWGSGKTTLVEFVLHYLEQKPEEDKPIIIRFNPWWFSGQENLVRHFFDELYTTLGSKFGKGMRKLVSSIKNLSDVYAEVPVVGSNLPQKLADKIPDVERRSVTKIKSDIADILKKKDKRILIVIDDIDRLNVEEIQQLFALIKAVADFPNVVYLLAFDRKIVANALSSVHGIPGDKFLEKIIQVAFEIPEVGPIELGSLLLERITNLIGNNPARFFEDTIFTGLFDGAQGYGYLSHIQSMMSTPRDVFRLVNTLTVTYAAVKYEVDPADFIAIEALRVFRPELYHIIRGNKRLFTTLHTNNNEQPVIQVVLQDELESVKKLIFDLFPNLPRGNMFHQSTRNSRRELRIHNPDIFDVYFRLSIPSDGVSHQEMLSIIELARKKLPLTEFFEAKARDNLNKCRRIFDRFPDYFGEIEESDALVIIRSLLEVGDDIVVLDEASKKFPSIKFVIARIIIDLLMKIDRQQQYDNLIVLLSATQSCYIPLAVILIIGQSHGKYGSRDFLPDDSEILSEEALTGLEPIATQKIQIALKSATAFENDNLRHLLEFWIFIDGDTARSWVQNTLISLPQIVDFVRGFFFRSGYDSYKIRDDLYQYLDLLTLREVIASHITQGDLDNIQTQIAKYFLEFTKEIEPPKQEE